MAVTRVTGRTFRQEVLESQAPVVVDFYADWCVPCHQISPILETLSREHEGIVGFVKVNIDEEPEVAQAYRVSSIPAVLLFEGGVPTGWSLGPKPGYVLERELGLSRAIKRSKKRAAADAGGPPPERGFASRLKNRWGSRTQDRSD